MIIRPKSRSWEVKEDNKINAFRNSRLFIELKDNKKEDLILSRAIKLPLTLGSDVLIVKNKKILSHVYSCTYFSSVSLERQLRKIEVAGTNCVDRNIIIPSNVPFIDKTFPMANMGPYIYCIDVGDVKHLAIRAAKGKIYSRKLCVVKNENRKYKFAWIYEVILDGTSSMVTILQSNLQLLRKA